MTEFHHQLAAAVRLIPVEIDRDAKLCGKRSLDAENIRRLRHRRLLAGRAGFSGLHKGFHLTRRQTFGNHFAGHLDTVRMTDQRPHLTHRQLSFDHHGCHRIRQRQKPQKIGNVTS